MRSSLAVRLGFGLSLLAGLMISGEALGQARGGARGATGGAVGGARIGTTTGARAGSSVYASGGALGSADITYDPETRNLIVVTDDETYEQIEEVLRSINRPAPQVLIKCAFVEIEHNKGTEYAVEGYVFGNVNNSTANPILGMATNLFGGLSRSGGGIYQILGEDFSATLRAVASAGKSKLISRPSILTRNNQTATISLGQQVPLISSSSVVGTTGNIVNQIQYQNVGISLQVTPYITADGMVEMYVTPQVSVLADRSQWVPTSTGIGGTVLSPVINSRAADTVVIVPDGQTAVIGGLMHNQDNVADTKIPILGDIPLLGMLFKHRIKDNNQRELLIFLTPFVVRHPRLLADVTEGEKDRSPMTRQSFTDEELERYLQTMPVERENGSRK